MEVRRNTRTAPVFSRQQFAQAEQTDYRPLLQGAADLRAGLDAGRRQSQSFELQKRLLEEKNALAEDLERRRRDVSRDQTQLAAEVDAAYTERANAVTEEYRQRGFDVDLVDQFFSGMGSLRNELGGRALEYQLSARKSRAVADTNRLIEEGTKTVMLDRNAYEETLRYIGDTIELNPDLTDEEKGALFAEISPTLRVAAAESWAMEDPEGLLKELDPDERWRREREAPVTGTAASVVSDRGTAVGPEQDAIRSAADELGVTPTELAALANYESGGTLDPSVVGGEGGRYVGIFQFGPEEQREYGVTRSSSFEDQVKALVRFAKDRGYKPGMGWKKLYTTINAGNPNASARAADINGTQSDHYRNIETTHFKKARQFLGINVDLTPGGERVPQPDDVIAVDPGASTSEVSPFDTTRDLPSADSVAPQAPAEPKQLHPVLRDLSGQERLRLLSIADAAVQKNTASQKAALDVVIANVKAEATSTGNVASPIPTDQEILAVYGEVAGPQIISDMKQTIALGKAVQGYAILSPAQLDAEVEKLKPTPGSPTYATDLELYEAANKARIQILEQRQADPAAYVLQNFPNVAAAADNPGQYYAHMKRALEQLGFDPNTTSLLPKAARDRIVEQWPSMSPQARRQWFNETYNRMGEAQIKAFARGAEGTDMEQELKIYAFGIGRLAPATIEQIFAGRDALKKDPARRPPDSKITELFRKSAFNGVLSMAPDASAALQEMAAALYVAKGGRADPNNLDEKLYQQALSEALGGALPFDDAKGAVKEFTILPPGVSGQRFRNWVEQLQPGELSALSVGKVAPKYGDLKTAVTLRDIVDDGVFVMLAPDYYGIKMASDGRFLKTAQGKNFVVRLTAKDVR